MYFFLPNLSQLFSESRKMQDKNDGRMFYLVVAVEEKVHQPSMAQIE